MLVYKLLMGKFGLYQGSSNSLSIVDFGVVLEDVGLSIIVTMSKNTSLAAKGALAHHLQLRTACKIQNGRQGSGKVSISRFLSVL